MAVGTAITQMTFYGIITPILTSRVLGSSLLAYGRETYLRSIPSAVVLAMMLMYLSSNNAPTGFLILLGQALVSALIYAIVAYLTLLKKEERQFVLDTAGGLIHRFRST